MLAHFPINVPGIGPYPDFVALIFTCVIIGLMIIGVKESSMVNRFFTLLNITLLTIIIVTGATRVDFGNWNLKTSVSLFLSLSLLNLEILYDSFPFLIHKTNTTWSTLGVNDSCSSKEKCGTGGFMPFGFIGIINGAAKCFYAYIGEYFRSF